MHEELKNIILSNIKIPTFQRHVELSLLDFGAVGDGNYDNTKIFKKAIDTCYEAGGVL